MTAPEHSPGSTHPSFFLDTSVISGYVNRDMRPEDQAAFDQLLALVADGKVSVVGSTALRKELDGIPDEYRGPHDAEYGGLQILRSSTTWLDSDEIGVPPVLDIAGNIARGLTEHLPDAMDAQHLYLCARFARPFLTVDYRTVLRHRVEVRRICGVEALSPSEYLLSISTSASTGHGAT